MNEYHKIQTIWKRDERGRILQGEWSLPEFEYLRCNKWEWTEKVDGTNVRVKWDGQAVTFCGKTDNAQMPTQLANHLVMTLRPLEGLFAETWPNNGNGDTPPPNVVLYGEGYGKGIQKGGVYTSDQRFVLFDVRVGQWWLRRLDVENVAAKLGLVVIPLCGRGTLLEMADCVQQGGPLSAWGGFQAEGIVARPAIELCCRSGERLICKIKARDFR